MQSHKASLYAGKKLTIGGASDPLLPKLIQAINNATEIAISVSFIQPSGLRLLFDPILEAIKTGVSLKILTSDYLEITHPLALRNLMLLSERGATCRIFECKANKSFHMKSYIFVRTELEETVEGCAWVGSNNISKTALLESHEWTLRHDFQPPQKSCAAIEFQDIRDQFTAIFNHKDTVNLTHHWIDGYILRHQKQKFRSQMALANNFFDEETIETRAPNAIQELALSALHQKREQGYQRGLVVLATGAGKTWLAAFDAKQSNAKRVLFVAHREEILTQAQTAFTLLNLDVHTGLYNGNQKDEKANYLFASINTIGKKHHLEQFSRDHFDYIVVDEFHHASAVTYRALLAYFQPKFMLGLTATPERSDQADILSLCDNNLVFERNLVHCIDATILVPFEYHGIYDHDVDYQEIPWRNGKFDPKALDFAFATRQRAMHIYEGWQKTRQTRTLAFCVSKSHTEFMSEYFCNKGIRAVAVYSDSKMRRNEALDQLKTGEIEVIFSVDLFNEGTDLPSIDTILMIRPTTSKILFLQQLGRGLRQSPETKKQKLVVIDFIGNHYSFLNRPAVLFNVSGVNGVLNGLNRPTLGKGCFVNFDPILVDFWAQLAKKIRATAEEDYQNLKCQLSHRPTATEFFRRGYDMPKMRKQHQSWFDLVAPQECDDALIAMLPKYRQFLLNGIEITAMTKCFKAILLEALLELDGFAHPPTLSSLAQKSHQVLARRPDLMAKDLPKNMQNCKENDNAWLKYWKTNPIKAFTENNNATGINTQWFKIENDHFVPTFHIEQNEIQPLHQLVQELVEFRLAQYIVRIENKIPNPVHDDIENIEAVEECI